ncbi:response regulator transcription factor [Marispirochaeta sp.]|uniref:response regulator transcription factor n=1 Tax=Marispirochaeta sp. TaxID=2038653 RepID=UPI0029C8784E|nr:response regulator transcription factor [Marispirochaeta sp.]
MARILVVEKELQLRRFLRKQLSGRGFKISEVVNVNEGILRVRTLHPYLILIDLDYAESDDLEVIHSFRRGSSAPIVCLVGKEKTMRIASILEAGADDCVVKPFGIRELISRIEISICPAMRLFPRTTLQKGEIVLDPIRGTVAAGNSVTRLQPAEYTVLRALIRHAGDVVPYNRLLSELGGPEKQEDRNRLRVYISKIRNILGKDSQDEELLVTVQGIGYRFRRRD